MAIIDRNSSDWFQEKWRDRPSRAVLAVDLLPNDVPTSEIVEVVVASALLGTASLEDDSISDLHYNEEPEF